jgi:hypothetical protein
MRIRLGTYQTPWVSNPYGPFNSRRKTLAYLEELSKDLLELKPRLNNYKNRRNEYRAYEYDKGIYVIDVQDIKGYVKGEEDLLNSNWWAMLLGLLRDSNVGDAVDQSLSAYTLRTQSTPTYGAAYLIYGTGATPETFTDWKLANYVGNIATSITISYQTDRTRITLSGTLSATATELGISQILYDASSYSHTTLLGRKTGSWSTNQAVTWNIDFLSPWVRAIGDIMYGNHVRANVTMVEISGSSFTARTSNDPQPGSAYLVASSDVISWSPSLYVMSNAFNLNSYYTDLLFTRYIRGTFIHGMYAPAADTQVNTIGLYSPVFDASGNVHITCVLVQPLSSPITLYGGKNNLIVLRIIAF